MNITVKAVIGVAIIVMAAVGGALSIESIGNDDAGIAIVDGAGKRIEISSPLDNVAVINKNIPKTMIMLGIRMPSVAIITPAVSAATASSSNARNWEKRNRTGTSGHTTRRR